MFEFETEREKAIWLAAWIDAEGNISLQKREAHKVNRRGVWLPWIAISNTNLEVMQALSDASQGSIRVVRKATGKWRQTYNIYVSPNKCRKLLPLIRPFLVIKQRQADLMMEALDLLHDNLKATGGSGDIRVSRHERVDRNVHRLGEIHQELTRLNQRGNGKE
jgi:hypothetical protein